MRVLVAYDVLQARSVRVSEVLEEARELVLFVEASRAVCSMGVRCLLWMSLAWRGVALVVGALNVCNLQ